jgi:hypothetical protein
VIKKILFTFASTNQIFLPLAGCLVFIKKGEEIRLCETLATNPSFDGERCQNLIPESREMIKIKHRNYEFDSSYTQQLEHVSHAYVHVQLKVLICSQAFSKSILNKIMR